MARTGTTEARQVRVLYRAASFKPIDPGADPQRRATPPSLEAALRAALDHSVNGHKVRDRWHLRVQETEDESFLTNHIRDPAAAEITYLFGELMRFRTGNIATALAVEQDTAELEVQALTLEAKQQLVDATTFWMVRGNHVLMMLIGAAPRSALELHLDWIIREYNATALAGSRIILADKLMLPGAAKRGNIKEIRIGGHVPPVHEVGQEEIVSTTTTGTLLAVTDVGTREKGKWERLIDLVAGTEEQAAKLKASVPEGAEITIDLRLGLRQAGTRIRRLPMNDLEEAVRNIDDGEISLQTDNGLIHGNTLRLSKPAKIALVNGLPDRDSVLGSMVTALTEFVASGHISDDAM